MLWFERVSVRAQLSTIGRGHLPSPAAGRGIGLELVRLLTLSASPDRRLVALSRPTTRRPQHRHFPCDVTGSDPLPDPRCPQGAVYPGTVNLKSFRALSEDDFRRDWGGQSPWRRAGFWLAPAAVGHTDGEPAQRGAVQHRRRRTGHADAPPRGGGKGRWRAGPLAGGRVGAEGSRQRHRARPGGHAAGGNGCSAPRRNGRRWLPPRSSASEPPRTQPLAQFLLSPASGWITTARCSVSTVGCRR